MQPGRHPSLPFLFLIAASVIACQGEALVEPSVGTLEITVAITGPAPDAGGHIARVDDEPGHRIYPGAPLLVDAVAGEHAVRIDEVAENCAVTGPNPVTVTIARGDTLRLSFVIACTATTGTLVVVASTTGGFVDQDGYLILVDGVNQLPILPTARASLGNLPPGGHSIELRGVSPNCRVSGTGERTATVEAGRTLELVFEVDCSVSPDIAFASNRTGEAFIHVVNADGSGLTPFTRGDVGVWSPDGQKMAVVRGGDLSVVNRDGTPFSSLFRYTDQTVGAGAGNPRWSPDSRSIAFTVATVGHCEDFCYFYEIWIIQADGTGLKKVAVGDSQGHSWSPDGQRLAFGNRHIWTINADGSGLTQVTSLARDSFGPIWSPDGTRIAFTAFVIGDLPFTEIFTVHPDGTGLRSLTAGQGEDREPVWSPDGTKIAFQSVVGGRLVYKGSVLAVMNSDGSGRAPLTEPDAGSVINSSWSPDGRSIALTRIDNVNIEANIEIYVIDADGSGLRNLSNAPSSDSGVSWSSR